MENLFQIHASFLSVIGSTEVSECFNGVIYIRPIVKNIRTSLII